MKKIVCLFFIVLFSLSLFGCDTAEKTTHEIIKVNDIVINKSYAYVDVGEKIILTAQVYPFNADNQKIHWRSDNKNVAEVDGGIVVGNSEGRTVITCYSEDGEIEDKCILYVSTPKLNYSKYPNNLTNLSLENKYAKPLSENSNTGNESAENEGETKIESESENETKNQPKFYFYEYRYNSNGINDLEDENTIYKDDNTIIKEYFY